MKERKKGARLWRYITNSMEDELRVTTPRIKGACTSSLMASDGGFPIQRHTITYSVIGMESNDTLISTTLTEALILPMGLCSLMRGTERSISLQTGVARNGISPTRQRWTRITSTEAKLLPCLPWY